MESNQTDRPGDALPTAPLAGDALADSLSEDLARAEQQELSPVPTGVEGSGDLEEERVKDEIDIQIDLLDDPDWVVRREAVITLGEMGDERCVAPLAKALGDGDWQVREVAVEAMGQVGSPAVETLLKLLRDWEVRKYAILSLGKIRDERVLAPLMLQLRNDEFKDVAILALVELGPNFWRKRPAAVSIFCSRLVLGSLSNLSQPKLTCAAASASMPGSFRRPSDP